MNASSSIRIDGLRLRVPGLSREQARRLGETVASRLADLHLEEVSHGRIPALTVHVRHSSVASVERLADEIIAQLRRSLE
jgi:hypothetical protein